jgi:hypothetical protein
MASLRRLTAVLASLMGIQALLGLAFAEEYRDAEWIRATWFGNDWFSLAVAVPLIGVSIVHAARGSTRGLLIWLGTLAYGVYNYAFYLLGASLNVFFPLYVGAVILAAATLIVAFWRIDVRSVADSFSPTTPVRFIAGSLLLIGVGLSIVWIGVWSAYVFADRPTPVEPEVFKLVAALDLTLMVPALICGSVALWRRRAWGYVIAATAGVQGSLYLAVLCLTSIVAIRRGITPAPGELPIWIPLALFTSATTAVFLSHARRSRVPV